jgi:hypothetical protein
MCTFQVALTFVVRLCGRNEGGSAFFVKIPDDNLKDRFREVE